VKDLGEDLEAFDDAGAGAVEIVIAIGDEDAGLAHGFQVAPARVTSYLGSLFRACAMSLSIGAP
jgi:hypothetical protein